MSNELTILALYGLVVMITLALQATGAANQLGMSYILSARDDERKLVGMTARLSRAVANSITALALFAPAILILAVKDAFSAQSLQAAQLFLVARVLYIPFYAFGIRGLRTAVWLGGFVATAWLYVLAL